MMVSGGRLVRIDFDDARYVTRSGARIGMSEREIRAIYGHGRCGSSRIPIPIRRAVIWSCQARREPFGMIFETDNGRAISYRVGYWENVQLIEGCS